MNINRIGSWFYDHRATLMSWGATIGTIGGSILSAKAVNKAVDRMDEALAKKKQALENQMTEELYDHDDIQEQLAQTELTTWEKIKAGGPAFIPAIIVEAATIGLIHGSDHENKRDIRKTKDMLAVTVAGFAAYMESVGAITDRTTEFAAAKRVEMMQETAANGDPPWDEKQTFHIAGRDGYFERTMEEVFEAEYLANRQFALKGNISLNEFYAILGLEPVHDTLVYENDGDCMGWDDYIGEVYYGYHWIDFQHIRKPIGDGRMYWDIWMPFGPHPLDEGVVEAETWEKVKAGDIVTAERYVNKMANP